LGFNIYNMKKITSSLSVLLLFLGSFMAIGQCANTSNIYAFNYNSKTYEVVKENKSWVDAASCAVQRGGILTEINDLAEQNAIFNELNNNANITTYNTLAADGGGGAYVWIGGNDIATEGNWVWDGNNDATSTQFWQGDKTGSAVGGLYYNWGDEPDDFNNNQDGLALSLTNWPHGTAGQWNDVNHTNELFYVIEHPGILSTKKHEFKTNIQVKPNPDVDFLTIETNGAKLREVVVLNALAQSVLTISSEDLSKSKTIDFRALNRGVYIVKIHTKNGKSVTKKIIK